jgi:hypothetical protein
MGQTKSSVIIKNSHIVSTTGSKADWTYESHST